MRASCVVKRQSIQPNARDRRVDDDHALPDIIVRAAREARRLTIELGFEREPCAEATLVTRQHDVDVRRLRIVRSLRSSTVRSPPTTLVRSREASGESRPDESNKA